MVPNKPSLRLKRSQDIKTVTRHQSDSQDAFAIFRKIANRVRQDVTKEVYNPEQGFSLTGHLYRSACCFSLRDASNGEVKQ